jgi:diacylglycerol O-acyltransferase
LVGRALRDPLSTVSGVIDYALSSRRVMTPAAPASPVLRRRSLASRSEAIDIKFSDLHKASKAGEGSINDAYLAAVCGALRGYHEAKGIPVATLPMAVPVNVRSDSDPAGGNRFAGVNIAAPIGVIDPVKRMHRVRAQMTRKREERAIEVVGVVAPLLSLVPDNVLESMAGSVVNSDVQASNVPGYPGDTYIAGAKVLRHYGIGPLPGVAMMAVLISRGGWVTVSTRYDRAAIDDEELWARCLLDGFNEILALGGPGRAIPVTFQAETEAAANGGVKQ